MVIVLKNELLVGILIGGGNFGYVKKVKWEVC